MEIEVGNMYFLVADGSRRVPLWAHGEPVIVDEVTPRGMYLCHHMASESEKFKVRPKNLRAPKSLEVSVYG